MKSRWYQQLLSVVLVLVMLIQLLPMQIIALSSENTLSGSASTSTLAESERPPVTIIGEDKTLRTETEKHFRMSDGSFIAVSYGIPVHYQDDNGNWQDIDNTLTLSANQTAYTSANEQVSTTFAANLSSGHLLTSENGDVSVTMSLLSSNQLQAMKQTATATTQQVQLDSIHVPDTSVEATLISGINALEVPNTTTKTNSGWTAEELIPEKLQSSVLYEDVYPGIDLLYTAYSHNVKEQIIVKESQSAYRYDFLLKLKGLTTVTNSDGSISLIDSQNSVRYTIPAPYMEDYNGATSTAVTYTLTQVADGVVLTVEADAAWINDENRMFPVTIDPTLKEDAGNSNDDIYATYVVEGTPDTTQATYQHLYFGYGYHDTVKEQRLFLHFNTLPTVPAGATVVDAMLSMYMFRITYQGCSDLGAGIYEVTEDKPSTTDYRSWIGSFSWNSQPDYDTSNMIDYTVIDGNPTDDLLHRYYDWNMTELVKKWYDNDTENRTIAVAITPATNTYGPSYCSVPVFMAYGDTYPPMLIVSYRNNTGIEDYYSYATLGAGAAGTAYIADATGQLTIVKGLVSYASAINPFILSLVYNSSASSAYPAEDLGYSMRMGTGWKLDVAQKIEAVTIGGTAYLKYYDGDGTIHYFLKNTADPEDDTYYDEDGLGLSIVQINATTYVLTDTKDNTYTFTSGLLTNVQDNNGNQYIIHIADGKITSIVQKNNGVASETPIATLAYSGNDLSTVTDAAGIIYTFNYTSGMLTSIEMDIAELAEYRYSGGKIVRMVDSESRYAIGVTYNAQSKVSSYGEYGMNYRPGAQVEVSYDGSDKTTYHDYGNDRTKGTSDDIFTSYLFDYSGRTVNAYSTDADRKIVGASTAIYYDGSEVDRRNNRTLRTASIGVAAEQELLNGGFEDADAGTWSFEGGPLISADNPRTGQYSLKCVGGYYVEASNASQPLCSGETYTLSAYVNTSRLTTITKSGIYILVTDANDNRWKSDTIDYRTSEDVDDGWIRISITFSAVTDGAHTISFYCLGCEGTLYWDDVQLEKSNGPSKRNLIENGNMQAGTYGWTLGEGAYTAISHGMYRKDNSLKSLAVQSSPISSGAKISQEVPINLSGVETYVLSGWAMGNAVPDNVTVAENYTQDVDKSFGLRAIVNYADNTREYFYAPFNTDVSTWQFTSLAIVPSDTAKTISSITVECVYEKNANIAYFDNISLVREIVQDMNYDTDGNLLSTDTTGLTSGKNTYEDGNLIETITSTGSIYSYTYDETYSHRLLSSTNGITTQSMGYDTYGNATTSTFAANEGAGMSLTASSSYTNNGNLLAAGMDTDDIRVSYQYSSAFSQMFSLPTTVLDGNQVATETMYDIFGRARIIRVANEAELRYDYENGNLASIWYVDSSANIQSYNMAYDVFGNMISFSINDEVLVTYEYGAKNGPLVKQTYANGDIISYTYDNLGRTATETYSDGHIIEYTYTGEGQLYSMRETDSDTVVTYLYTYNSVGNLIMSEKKDEAGDVMLRLSYDYDSSGQLVGQSWQVGHGSIKSESYTYNTDDDTISSMTTASGDTLQFNYDDLRRLSSVNAGTYTKSYSYRNISDSRTTEQVSQLQYTGLPSALTFGYTYDDAGNFATYSAPGQETITYTYDYLGQLLQAAGDEVYTYTYDNAGNILTANGHTYTYGDTSWKDLLTAFDGETITYDASGNPLSYYNGTRWAFTWENGRTLATASDGTTSIAYTYDAIGRRSKKVIGNTTHEYLFLDDQLYSETITVIGENESVTTDTLYFFYDESGSPYAMTYNGTKYYYITNLQGDVIYLVTADGSTVASYEYDPYGNIVSATGAMAEINPLRYRGYYYDSSLEMYYLQSRYYDPAICRFINADDTSVIDGSNAHVLENNLFAYCLNNPVNMSDENGYWPKWATKLIVGTAVIAAAAVLTVATAGTGTALACFAVGALKGAAIGAAVGAATGAATGAVSHRISTGSWKGSGKAALEGAADGYMSGAISGFISGGLSSSACFVAGTAVLVSAGYVAIETIEAGDLVWASDPDTGEVALKKVVQTFVNEAEALVYVTVNGEEIICTNEHPFYSPVKGWMEACKLRAGDILVTVNGEYVVVEKVQHELLEAPIAVYNFEVEDFHTYYVGDTTVLVHNMCAKPKNIYNSIKDAPNYNKNFVKVQNGLKKVKVNNRELLEQLNQVGSGWKKVYQNGWINGQKVSLHYFQDASGKIFDFAIKYGRWS